MAEKKAPKSKAAAKSKPKRVATNPAVYAGGGIISANAIATLPPQWQGYAAAASTVLGVAVTGLGIWQSMRQQRATD